MTEQISKLKQPRFNILLMEDDEGDVVLTERALEDEECGPSVHVVKDGVEAMWYLRREGEFAEAPRPDLILLDLQMPRKDGREVLAEIKRDPEVRSIPVVVPTMSDSDEDKLRMYDHCANCYLTKPATLTDYIGLVKEVARFWTAVARRPRK